MSRLLSAARKMPIFSRKFDIKSVPARSKRQMHCPQMEENLNDYRAIKLHLGGKCIQFVNGAWSGQHGSESKDVGATKRDLQRLEEANNLNQIKIDVLLDMLTENLAELNVLRGK